MQLHGALPSTPALWAALVSVCLSLLGSIILGVSVSPAIMLALRLVALALGAFRPFSQVFDLTSGPIVQGWVA